MTTSIGIARLPNGQKPQLIVFDLDDTLIQGNSCVHWARYLKAHGIACELKWTLIEKKMLLQYMLGKLDIHEYLRESIPSFGYMTGPERTRMVDAFVDEVMKDYVYPDALRTIEAAKAEGIPMVIVSASNTFMIVPIAKKLFGLEDVLGIDLEENPDGSLTGEIVGVPTFQEGKWIRLEAYLKAHQIPAENVVFYTDSRNDLPLAREVGLTVAVNPDDTLREEALAHHWPIKTWALKGKSPD